MLCRTKNRLNLAKSAKIEVASKKSSFVEFAKISQNPYQYKMALSFEDSSLVRIAIQYGIFKIGSSVLKPLGMKTFL
jgi:hypothetical protein